MLVTIFCSAASVCTFQWMHTHCHRLFRIHLQRLPVKRASSYIQRRRSTSDPWICPPLQCSHKLVRHCYSSAFRWCRRLGSLQGSSAGLNHSLASNCQPKRLVAAAHTQCGYGFDSRNLNYSSATIVNPYFRGAVRSVYFVCTTLVLRSSP